MTDKISPELRKARLKAIANVEIMKLVAVSNQERESVKSAKTNTKKNYHLKKLKKNNTKLAEMLVAVEKYAAQIDSEQQDSTNVDS